MRRPVAYLALALVAVAAVALRRAPVHRATGVAPGPVASVSPPAEPDRTSGRAQPLPEPIAVRTARRRLPRELRGTSPDGELAVDDGGRLVVSRETRRFFDYFLAAAGALSPAQNRDRLAGEIRARLPSGPAAEALALLDRYLAYRARAAALAPGDDAERARALHALRRDVLGQDAAGAFFGEEETLESAALERRRIAADGSLAPEERARRLAAVEDQLPVTLRAARAQAIAPLRLVREEARLRAEGAGPADIRALRERMFGAAAADRLEALDRERAGWQARLDAYRAARDAIAADMTLAAADRARAIEALRADRFTPTERLRVAALDEAAGGPR